MHLILLLLAACDNGRIPVKDDDGDGFSSTDDCDDGDAEINPEADERCNGADDNCDGDVDEGVEVASWRDVDGDGFGDGTAVYGCSIPSGYVDNGLDCNDGAPDAHPGAEEVCNGIDDDCDGEADPGFNVWYTDADGDGYGDDATAVESCTSVTGDVDVGGDCDDADPTRHPGADDECGDGIDMDCDDRELECTYGGEYSMTAPGAKVYAEGPNYYAGEYIDVGDVNGDGFADVALTTMYADGYNGGGYVVYGPLSGTTTLEESGDKLKGSRKTMYAGRSIAIGDVNDDGFDDVAIGAADDTCKEWVLFGPLDGDVDIETADVIRDGTYNTEVGHGSDLADVNGDNVADLIVGAYENDDGGRDAGKVFIEFGPMSAGEESIDDAADASLLGESRTAYAGRYVHAGGDVDGDGIGDIIAGAPYASGGAPSGGGAYLVYGPPTLDFSLADADAKFLGEHPSEYAAEGISMGDVNGDGKSDVILGSMSSEGKGGGGAVYVVFGPANTVSGLDGADRVMLGDANQQMFGLGLSATDINGDGSDDLLVGGRGDSRGGAGGGSGFLYWGPLPDGLGPSDADAIITAEGPRDAMGASTAIADLDGDGVSELIFGAPGDDQGGVAAGALFVLYPTL